MQTTTLKIQGMHCVSCKLLIEDVCKDVPGVMTCEVNPETGIATITHEDTLDFTLLKKEIEQLGEYKIEQIV